MSKRLGRLALVPLLVFVLVAPTYVGAQDGDAALPPMGSGNWTGSVSIGGFTSTDRVRNDGSFGTALTDVIDDTTITMDFVVGGNGQISSGTMTVDLTWFIEQAGTSPATFDPYHIVHDHHQTGTLAITGNADRLVAAGDLTWEHNTNSASDGLIEAVSGTEIINAEWVYQAYEVICARVQATLVGATGTPVMTHFLASRNTVDEGYEAYNRLAVSLIAYPADVEHPDEIWGILEAVDSAADAMSDREIPETVHFFDLVGLWGDLNAELASLDECQTEIVGPTPQSTKSWLTQVLRDGVHKALNNPEYYEASEFISLWDILVQESALTDTLGGRIRGALADNLDEAISNGDEDTIFDIFVWAANYGAPDLYDKAKAALEGGSG